MFVMDLERKIKHRRGPAQKQHALNENLGLLFYNAAWSDSRIKNISVSVEGSSHCLCCLESPEGKSGLSAARAWCQCSLQTNLSLLPTLQGQLSLTYQSEL